VTDYQCTSVSFIKLSNRIKKSIRQRESNRIIFPESECSNTRSLDLALQLVCSTVAQSIAIMQID